MRYPQGIVIDPRKVLPSRHSIFIRGLPHSVKIEDIKELFSNQCNGNCTVDFFSYSEDKSNLFVAMRFDSHNVARRMLLKYDGESILGHKVKVTWFKDIRKARKKVMENEKKYRSLLAKPQNDQYDKYGSRRFQRRRFFPSPPGRYHRRQPFRQCVSSSNSSRSRSRSSKSAASQSHYAIRRHLTSNVESNSDNSDSSGSIVQSHHSGRSVGASNINADGSRTKTDAVRSSSASGSSDVTRVSLKEDIKDSDPEVLRVACEINHSPDEACKPSWKPLESYTSQSKDESKIPDNPVPLPVFEKNKRQKRKKRSERRRRRERGNKLPSISPSDEDCTVPGKVRVLTHKYVPKTSSRSSDEGCSTGKHRNISNSPCQNNSRYQQVASTQNLLTNEDIHMTKSASDMTAKIQSPVGTPNQDCSQSTVSSVPKTHTADASVQAALTSSNNLDLEPGYMQLAFLSEAKVDEIFSKKRLIEAAYRLDCESYTKSISKLIRSERIGSLISGTE